MAKHLLTIKYQLKEQFMHVPIYGFKSGKYELTFVVKTLRRYNEPTLSNLSAKSSGYMKLDFGMFSCLGMWLLGPPDLSLDETGKPWGLEVEKDHFAYTWFDAQEKLKFEGLPERKHWYKECTKS